MSRVVIVGVDALDPSRSAMENAIRVSQRRDAKLVMVHVEPPEPARNLYARPTTVARYQEMATLNRTNARKALGELQSSFDDSGVEISRTMQTGSPAEQIIEIASERSAELIVVGSGGHRGLNRFLLGSVAERLCNHAGVDVIVAREGGESRAPILVPIDPAQAADRALQAAVELVGEGQAITLLHCVFAPSWRDVDKDEAVSSSTRHLEELASPLREGGLQVDVVVKFGWPPEAIVDQSERHEMIIISSQGHGAAYRFFIGSVATKVVRHASCSVFLVRP